MYDANHPRWLTHPNNPLIQPNHSAVIIDAAGVPEVDLSALFVIDELVTEMAKQGVEVFIAGACPRVAKSLEAYDLLDEVRFCFAFGCWVVGVLVHAAPPRPAH